jgi:hypothetical protein
MARGWIHTRNDGGTWFNEIEGRGLVSSHRTRDEAIAVGRGIARSRKTEHLIHNLDGTIADRNSYGLDPFPPPV